MSEERSRRILSFVLPIGLCIIFIILLQTQVIHRIFNLKLIQLPLPSGVLESLINDRVKILNDCRLTLQSVFPGMILGAALGILLAGLATVLPNVGYGSLTLITAMNSIPVLALAPLMIRWFPTDASAKTAVVTIVCMGGMSVNAYKGFNALSDSVFDMMKSYASTKSQIFFKLRLPNSVPYLFTALKTNVATGMMAAVLSEFYAKQTSGLGYMIKSSLKIGNQKVRGWVYILVTALISILIYAFVCVLEKKFVKGGGKEGRSKG